MGIEGGLQSINNSGSGAQSEHAAFSHSMKNTEGSKATTNTNASSSGASTSIGTADNAGNNFSSTGPLTKYSVLILNCLFSAKDYHNYSSSGKGGDMTSSSTHSSVIGNAGVATHHDSQHVVIHFLTP